MRHMGSAIFLILILSEILTTTFPVGLATFPVGLATFPVGLATFPVGLATFPVPECGRKKKIYGSRMGVCC